jgi:hypothetical protein
MTIPQSAPAGTTIGNGSTTPAPAQWRGVDQNPAGGSSFYGPSYQPAPTNYHPTSYAAYDPAAGDYRSTLVDERSDPTRMLATDASSIRAPANFNQTANWQMIPNPIVIPGNIEYQGNPQVVGNPSGLAISYPALPNGYPNMAPPNSGNYVLAESSTQKLSNDPNYRVGWRQLDATPNLSR